MVVLLLLAQPLIMLVVLDIKSVMLLESIRLEQHLLVEMQDLQLQVLDILTNLF